MPYKSIREWGKKFKAKSSSLKQLINLTKEKKAQITNVKHVGNSTTNKMKQQSTEWKKIPASHICDKRLIFKIYRKFIQLNSKKKKELNEKISRGSEYTSSKEDIQMAKRYIKRCSTCH